MGSFVVTNRAGISPSVQGNTWGSGVILGTNPENEITRSKLFSVIPERVNIPWESDVVPLDELLMDIEQIEHLKNQEVVIICQWF